MNSDQKMQLAYLLAEYRAAIVEHAPHLEGRLNDRALMHIGRLVGWKLAEKEGLV